MKALNLHLLSVDCCNHPRRVKYCDAARRQDTEERRRANGTRRPQRGSARAFANVVVNGVRGQDGGGVQSAGVATASGSRRTDAVGRTGLYRSRLHRSASTCYAALADFYARRCALVCANSRALSASGNAHSRRGRATKTALSGVRSRGFKFGATRRAARAQSRARNDGTGAFVAARAGGIRHSQVKGRTRPARVFATGEFSAFAIARRPRCTRSSRVASTSADLLRWVALASTLRLSSSSAAARLPSPSPLCRDAAIV